MVNLVSRYPFILGILAILYLVSPFDLIPEAFTGLVGFIDDLVIMVIGVSVMNRLKRTQAYTGHSTTLAKKNPYEILGVSKSASPVEIKEAYRKIMAQYHPDKVAHLGDELKKTATRKTIEILEAYEALTKR